jgi:hypothetical protein
MKIQNNFQDAPKEQHPAYALRDVHFAHRARRAAAGNTSGKPP